MIKEYLIELKTLNRSHNLFLPFLLLIISIPLPIFINNILLLLFAVIVFSTTKKRQIKYDSNLFFLVLFFLLSLLSLCWSIDFKSTLNTIPRLIPLMLIPILFMMSQLFVASHIKALLKYYSFTMVVLAIVFMVRAVIRYLITNDFRAFFYHGENDLDYGLVPKLLNAIHVSVFVAMGYFFFISKQIKKTLDYIAILILAGFILLLSAKNIIFIVIFLTIIQLFYFSRLSHKLRLKNLIVFILLIVLIFSYGQIKDRFEVEFQTNTAKSFNTNVIEGIPSPSHYVSINEAWTNKTFTENDYFNGTAFRVYQFRIFLEMLSEDAIFWKGYGLNASYPKIESKGVAHHIYLGDDSNNGYQKMNFHNQFVQSFADLGIFGFLLTLSILIINLKNGVKAKDFMHFAFAILMISLFLTESFLLRQRGVMFFTAFYCLFNFGIIQNSSKAK